MLGAAAIYALSSQRREIMKSVDYSVLVFFGGMFVVTSALWSSGAVSLLFMNYIPTPDPSDPVQSNAVISIASVGISQVLSNVPFVALYNFVMADSGITGQHVDQWMMLAAASTIAGNLTILGAASNIIILEAAESRGVHAFSFLDFFKVGSIVTAANLAMYYMFIVLI
jgi:Na+/H+ antiporter NhaD/arsenite permease-like protein